MNVEIELLSQMKEADQVHRVLDKHVALVHHEPRALDPEFSRNLSAQGQPPPVEARRSFAFGLKRGTKDTGQIAHILGHQEIVFHEAFNAETSGMVGIAHKAADFRLQVEGQAFFRPARNVMKMTAQGENEVQCLGEQAGLRADQNLTRHQLVHVVHCENIFGNPEQSVKVA